MPLNTTPRTWVTGELLTATLLNVELRDALTNLQAAWTAWTPSPALTVVSGTNPTMGNSTVVGATHQIGKTILWRLRIVLGSTFAAGSGTYLLALPFSINGILSSEDPVGYGQVLAGARGARSRSMSTARRLASWSARARRRTSRPPVPASRGRPVKSSR